MEELSLDKDFVTYFEIRSGGILYISGFLIMLLGRRDFSFEGTLLFIEIYGEVVGSGGSNIAFRVNSDIRMISLISEERRNTGSSAQSIIVSKLCER